ncbi:MAG: bifunctional 2-polyprenyl-6-hydroxyphenol methylase/3-demethylubiquinol 3-O-methyltransferase UbiG [Bacteriovoracaceae bacterium]
METSSKINNAIYDSLGERWYTAYDDPIALLRAENRIKLPWIVERVTRQGFKNPHILDVGCGAGFLCNELSEKGYQVKGIDISEESLAVARKYDKTKLADYQVADAYKLPYESNSFDVITCLDFLEHVDRPQDVIKEIARVLRPEGLFFFHTFNRNIFSWILIIKAVELFVKNTPKDMHVIDLFIKPSELIDYCEKNGMEITEMTGIRPKFSTIPLSSYITGVVPESLEFQLTKSLLLSYLGVATKSRMN